MSNVVTDGVSGASKRTRFGGLLCVELASRTGPSALRGTGADTKGPNIKVSRSARSCVVYVNGMVEIRPDRFIAVSHGECLELELSEVAGIRNVGEGEAGVRYLWQNAACALAVA